MAKVKVPNKSKSAKTKGLGGKRCCRFSISVSNDTEKKLDALAVSTGFSRSELADYLLQACVNSPDFVYALQEKHNVNEKYKVYPTIINVGGKQQVVY
ncbi:MAG: ribbon-helix-helix domain-containing protein [Bacillota bacterium]|jgi:hypothetical protein|nr:ribbon-helix-helix domain-containing protein [Bacillus sp. F19]